MPIKEHWGIENPPLWHFLCLLEERIPSNNCKIFLTETLENMQETKDLMFSLVTIAPKILSTDNIKQKKFDLDRKLKSWLKFEPNFLTWLPNDKLEKTAMYLLFSLFIQLSAIEIR